MPEPTEAFENQSPQTRQIPGWEPPAFEVVSLDCEITAYAPEGDAPLF